MKYLKQVLIIVLFSFIGELCHRYIPYPIPASIYGMVLLFAALVCKVVKIEAVQGAGAFLVELLPLLFVAPVVGLVDCWPQVQEILLPLFVIVVVTTVFTFWVSGAVTKWICGKRSQSHE